MTRLLGTTLRLAAVSVTLCLGACAANSSQTDDAPGDSVVTPAVVSVTFQSDGSGLHSIPPAGATCNPWQWTYSITLATHELTWAGCIVTGAETDPAGYTPATADKALDSYHWPAVHDALVNVAISDETSCGADKDRWTFTVTKASGAVVYGDDFYACERQYPGYVTSGSLDSLQTTLSTLP